MRCHIRAWPLGVSCRNSKTKALVEKTINAARASRNRARAHAFFLCPRCNAGAPGLASPPDRGPKRVHETKVELPTAMRHLKASQGFSEEGPVFTRQHFKTVPLDCKAKKEQLPPKAGPEVTVMQEDIINFSGLYNLGSLF